MLDEESIDYITFHGDGYLGVRPGNFDNSKIRQEFEVKMRSYVTILQENIISINNFANSDEFINENPEPMVVGGLIDCLHSISAATTEKMKKFNSELIPLTQKSNTKENQPQPKKTRKRKAQSVLRINFKRNKKVRVRQSDGEDSVTRPCQVEITRLTEKQLENLTNFHHFNENRQRFNSSK